NDEVAPFQGVVRMVDGRIVNRRLGQTRDHGSFGQSQVFCRLAEVKLRRSLEAVNSVPEVNLIGIQRQNLLLGKAPFNLDRQQHFLDLAMERAVRREKQI